MIYKNIKNILVNKLISKKDNYDKRALNMMLKSYINYTNDIIKLNKKLNNKIRLPNFPSDISENLVKFSIFKKYERLPTWKNKSGDLNMDNECYEVKAFSNNKTPNSFGPSEKWDKLYFVDCCDFKNYKFKIYEINLKHTSSYFKKIKINKNETYNEQCLNGRRPRISFDKLKDQIPKRYCKLIFNGLVKQL